MLPLVKTNTQKLEKYRGIIPENLFVQISDLARGLKGSKVIHINATPRGGGVAEVLKSLVPLMKGIGIDAEWYTIPPREDFFKITKEIHNALQGREYAFPFWHRVRYLQHIERTAFLMKDMKADIWVVHDPQPAGVILYLPSFHPSICHLHIDLTSPVSDAWNFFVGTFKMYDRIVLTSKDFIKKEIKNKTITFAPAINSLMEKNKPLAIKKARMILESFGINTKKPLVSQVSRFDPWKDPLGVVEVYKIAKKKIPNLQLALVGLFLAQDDPGAMEIFKETEKAAKGDPDIFLFSNADQIGSLKVDTFVNVFQTASDVILQKSIREGFGLSICEAMWKEKAVIAGKTGGTKLQIENGRNGFLVSSSKEAAKRIVQLIKNPQLAEKLGRAAQETVREKFLMPRLLRDYLKLFKDLIR